MSLLFFCFSFTVHLFDHVLIIQPFFPLQGGDFSKGNGMRYYSGIFEG